MSQFTLPGAVAVIVLVAVLLVLPLLSVICACIVYCVFAVSVVCMFMSPVGCCVQFTIGVFPCSTWYLYCIPLLGAWSVPFIVAVIVFRLQVYCGVSMLFMFGDVVSANTS